MKMQGVNTYHLTAKVSIHKHKTVCQHTCIFEARSHFIMTLDFFNYCSLSALYTLMVLPTLTLSAAALKVDASASEKLPANSANTISGGPTSTSHDLSVHHFIRFETPQAY